MFISLGKRTREKLPWFEFSISSFGVWFTIKDYGISFMQSRLYDPNARHLLKIGDAVLSVFGPKETAKTIRQ